MHCRKNFWNDIVIKAVSILFFLHTIIKIECQATLSMSISLKVKNRMLTKLLIRSVLKLISIVQEKERQKLC